MQDFSLFFRIGWEHIISWDALDHILFISALAVIFQLDQWRQVVILVTAFTIGHLLTLWLTVTGYVEFGNKWVEFLIPVTIILTALSNLWKVDDRLSQNMHYIMAMGFGLIHGLGYANAIRFGITEGQSLGWSLFSFNIGLEIGQILVVSIVLVLGALVVKTGIKRSWWINTVSVIICLKALLMAWERNPSTHH